MGQSWPGKMMGFVIRGRSSISLQFPSHGFNAEDFTFIVGTSYVCTMMISVILLQDRQKKVTFGIIYTSVNEDNMFFFEFLLAVVVSPSVPCCLLTFAQTPAWNTLSYCSCT